MPPNAERRRGRVAPSTVDAEEGPKIWREDNGVSAEVPLFPALPRKFAEGPLPTFTMAEVSCPLPSLMRSPLPPLRLPALFVGTFCISVGKVGTTASSAVLMPLALRTGWQPPGFGRRNRI